MKYTTHGHRISTEEDSGPEPEVVVRCGGIDHCSLCRVESDLVLSKTSEPRDNATPIFFPPFFTDGYR